MNGLPAPLTRGHYTHEIQLGNQHDVHALAVAAVPVGSTVLDVGCADGSLSRHLIERGCTVIGIDVDDVSLKEAARVISETYRVDLMSDLDAQLISLMDTLGNRRFDVILAMDVLEHVIDSSAVLRSLVHNCLAAHGRVVISVPNVAHGAVRLALLSGRFDYRPAGLLDESHLRFFTRDSIHALLGTVGLKSIASISVGRELHDTEISVNLDDVAGHVIETVRDDPDSFTYQHFLVAVPIELSEAGSVELYSLVKSANELATREAARREFAAAELESTAVQKLLQNRVAELEATVSELHRSETWRIGFAITQPVRFARRFGQRIFRSH